MDPTRLVAESILSAAADAVVATDHDGVIRVWNPGAERIFGYRADEALGQSLDLIIPESLRPRHWEGFRRVMATGESHLAKAICSRCRVSARTASASRWNSPSCR
jgi:PAS domain S-box-containing protein